jgi:hypothetical protein
MNFTHGVTERIVLTPMQDRHVVAAFKQLRDECAANKQRAAND